MENLIQISKTHQVMAFVATCIEATARTLNTSYKTVFERMKHVKLIENFILPNYETLHSESRENIALNLIECLNAWEEKK
ncbi:MAG: DUF3791 domain-containing protein [Muribaculaceae bacterium]|nr:DUF3791 domain-containing protein [Muribaculaceae bacterium]MBQ1723667.1 DUF3791 domain-containing protein [Muribaculaceae bacterium]MBQ2491185.1 DUF3791 domain-containing protein [Muribaculaceae bacterium]MBQ4007788.1 DUF3791 domain-containing protein [Muribaculaceae bacterium]